ncbi:UPF0149 family protein [Endozoicomonas sp. 4G]|uniref:UPF0149 family protein n=1 Tax=Endozoicomonas sp. 4G TaxID=2872754 RepID=UPI002078D9F4|nr:UPF0149 family protein [Endozoicomonas sp. 4G]
MSPYTSPISELLGLGYCDWQDWTDYSRFEFNESHVPELLKLAQDWTLFDHDDADIIWSPVHAWRVLGILQAKEAVEPLLELFYKEDEHFVIAEYLPSAVGRLGAVATDRLWSIASNVEENEDARDLAIEALRWNVTYHEVDREKTVAGFQQLLEDREDDETYLNTALVSALTDLRGKESANAIREAFERGKVDREVQGDIEDVEIELGLRETRSFIPDWRFDQTQREMLETILSEYGQMSYQEVEGFLFGIWGSPQQVPPNRWLKKIFGEAPAFTDEQQEKDAHRIVFNLYGTIERTIEMGLDIIPEDCLSETPEDERFPNLQKWSKGFGEANVMLVNFWEEVFQHKAMKELEESWTACTILLSVWSNPEQLLEKAKNPGGPNIEKMLSAVPSVARELASLGLGISTRWDAIMDTPDPVSVTKIGRNDPCPCGSGKKYKKCCGA